MRGEVPAVISVYLTVPLDLAGHRGLPTRARELVKAAVAGTPEPCGAEVRYADLEAIAQAVSVRSHEWLGRTVAIFACDDLGLFEAMPLPGTLPELAVVATRPYVRPLLAALQRPPVYRAAVLDTKPP